MRISDWSSDVCSSDLIPAGKIAALKTGELAGMLAVDTVGEYTGKYAPSAVHCRVNLDVEAIKKEEAGYVALPSYYDFKGRKEEVLRKNFSRITDEVGADRKSTRLNSSH